MKSFSVICMVLLFGSTFSLNDSKHTHVKSCAEGGQLPVVDIVTNGVLCVKPPCIVIPGTEATLSINFTSPDYVPSITPKFVATYAGANIPYSTGQKDACEYINNTACPLGEGEFVTYVYGLKIQSWFPSVSVGLEVSFINDYDNEVIVCFAVDLQVKSG
ncbi:ecdysteroid-regulated 16 kDa protein-like [Diorhabda carinulata]|uniref:ecdysteroid-regulated 16 kDa protein-like n=1 Tax=Diorhabda carinulata TaxID=1163345 RepID=UPI0025A083D3|nr:ecdysteroid-regulated 16 kDa protein-like [Diorhabda carinulata]